jgi:hypothetical protein
MSDAVDGLRSRLAKLSRGFHGADELIFCWCVMLDSSSLIDSHSQSKGCGLSW